jgi:hypothetical protein
MAVVKRCPFCHKKLDNKGYCQNKSCVDYKRTLMHEQEQNNNNGTNEGSNSGEGSEGQN